MDKLLVCLATFVVCGAAEAEPVMFVLDGLITSNDGDPFGTSNGFVRMTARYDSDQKFASTGRGGDTCFEDVSCPINFGSGEGDGWALEFGATTVTASQSESEEFPGFVFSNGNLVSIEELTFVIGVHDSPASFKPTEGTGCATLPCSFEGSDGNGNTFTGFFSETYIEVIGTPPDTRTERKTLPATLSQPAAPVNLQVL
jgi:hypothetical protein